MNKLIAALKALGLVVWGFGVIGIIWLVNNPVNAGYLPIGLAVTMISAPGLMSFLMMD